jgi:hypothetical protein
MLYSNPLEVKYLRDKPTNSNFELQYPFFPQSSGRRSKGIDLGCEIQM